MITAIHARKAHHLLHRYFIEAFTGMAQGLFVTLIAGTIFKQIGMLIGKDTGLGVMMILTGNFACVLMGAGIGIGIARQLKADGLALFSCAVAGVVGAYFPDALYHLWVSSDAFALLPVAQKIAISGSLASGIPGNPIGAYIVAVCACECVCAVAGKTRLDILLIPFTVMTVSLFAVFLAIPAIALIALVSRVIEISTLVQPFLMGMVIAVIMGILLTLPTSSAAIWISVALGVQSDSMLLAGGAAVTGCACHMVGYAVMTYRENRLGGLIAQGIGTSMLQIPNIMKHPQTLIPPVVASAICGPLATCIFQLRCNAGGGGMGTSGLVGVFGVLEASSNVLNAGQMWSGIVLLLFVFPALISYAVCEWMRRKGWILPEYVKLPS